MHVNRVPRGTLMLASLAALLGLPARAASQGLMVSGYADIEASFENIDSDNTDFYFDNHHFNLIFLGALTDNIFVSGEAEYEHAGDEIELDYGYLSYTGLKNLTISGGKFIVPFGRFNKDLHPTWINKMPDRPLGMKNILPQTYSDVGLWIVGAAPFGAGNRVTVDAFVVNGLMGEPGGDIRDMRENDREKRVGARSDNKAIGGRVGLEFAPLGLDFGGSLYTGSYNESGPDLNLRLLGLDAAYRTGGLEVRGEYVRANQDVTGGELVKTGGYVQVAYRIDNFEPVVRFSSRNMPGDEADASRFGLGFSYYLSPAAAVRGAYFINSESTGFEKKNNGLIFQFTTSF